MTDDVFIYSLGAFARLAMLSSAGIDLVLV
jgi:hypothetical protein